MSRRADSRRPYRKAGDDELLALIRRLVDERPTYGYRRIRRLINPQRKADGKPPVNGKRVLRIMQANKLTRVVLTTTEEVPQIPEKLEMTLLENWRTFSKTHMRHQKIKRIRPRRD